MSGCCRVTVPLYPNLHIYGIADAEKQTGFVCVGEIEMSGVGDAAAHVAYTTPHETGHQWCSSPSDTDFKHDATPSHCGTDDCLMSYTCSYTDSIYEYCVPHLYQIRQGQEPL